MNRPTRTEDAVDFHSALAQQWSAKYDKPHFHNRRATLHNVLGDLHGNAWLDAGCGTGDLSLLLAEHGASVTSVEKSAGMLAQCKVPVICADVEALPFPMAAFDGVLCSSVLEYLSLPDVALKEMRRVIKPGGRMLLSVPNRLSVIRAVQRLSYVLLSRPEYMKYSKTSFSAQECTRFLRQSGFEVTSTHVLGATDPIFRNTRFGASLLLYDCVRAI